MGGEEGEGPDRSWERPDKIVFRRTFGDPPVGDESAEAMRARQIQNDHMDIPEKRFNHSGSQLSLAAKRDDP